MEEAKKGKCCKRLIYKHFVQVSGLCDPQFLSYLPKRFTHLCRALYGDAMLVHRFGAPIWPPENNKKHLEFTFSMKALSFHSRTSIRTHKHIFWYLKWLHCWKSRGETFLQRDSIPILMSRTVKIRKFKLLYFRNENATEMQTWTKIYIFVYLQPSVNKNS